MITIVKRNKGGETYTHVSVEDFVRGIRIGEYQLELRRPSVRIAAEYAKRNGQVLRKAYNGLVLLRIRRLPGEEELRRVREDVRTIPYTHLAWTDREENTLYIVCRIAWAEGCTPETEEQMERYQANAYKQLHYLYSTQLRMSIDTEQPALKGECRWCQDAEIYFKPDSMAIYVDDRELSIPAFRQDQDGVAGQGPLPGMGNFDTMSHVYYANLTQAKLDARAKSTRPEEEKPLTLQLLAEYCHQSGMPMYFPVTLARNSSMFHTCPLLVEQVFEAEYAEEMMTTIPYGKMPKSTILTLRTEAFLKAHYELRRNALTDAVQFRERNAYEYDFQDLTEKDLNSMTIRALKAGLESWDKDVRRLVNSNDIRLFNPLDHYIYRLPEWDGRDRVTELARRIPTDTPNVERYLHVWLLSMVAHWLGKDPKHGNAIVPMLIGQQGCGKTTFASMLLPHCLQKYFNDKVDFRSESDIMSALSSFALINIDEFDSLKRSQQPILKYLLTKSEVKFRPAFGRTIVERRRYASFFATTNLTRPLVDRTGSRRFVCIKVRNGEQIDITTPIDHDQLYAQLLQEIRDGWQYWFDNTDTQQIQAQNAPFMRVESISEMLDLLYQQPSESEENWLSVEDVIQNLQQSFPTLVRTNNTSREVGQALRSKGYAHKKTNSCSKYNMVSR